MVEHVDIPDGERHEPKGADSATLAQVYRADGANSGDWKKIYTNGWEDINDVATTGSPIALTVAGTYYDLTNDGTGVNTRSDYRLPGTGAIWNTATNEFEWDTAGLSVGDTVDIRFDLSVVNSATNGHFDVAMDMAHGHGSEFQLPVRSLDVKAAGTHRFVFYHSIYVGAQFVLDNPAKVVMNSDSTGDTVTVNGWYVRSTPINPFFA